MAIYHSFREETCFLINAHHISPCFMLDRLISKELWSLVASTSVKSNFAMISFLHASKEALTHPEVIHLLANTCINIIVTKTVDHVIPKVGGHLRTISFGGL